MFNESTFQIVSFNCSLNVWPHRSTVTLGIIPPIIWHDLIQPFGKMSGHYEFAKNWWFLGNSNTPDVASEQLLLAPLFFPNSNVIQSCLAWSQLTSDKVENVAEGTGAYRGTGGKVTSNLPRAECRPSLCRIRNSFSVSPTKFRSRRRAPRTIPTEDLHI